MEIRWHPEARLEANAAATFYHDKRKGLEQRFLAILDDALNRIRRRPHMYQSIESTIHKCKLSRFPYGVIYRRKSDVIEILAVMHLRREPGYWRHRAE